MRIKVAEAEDRAVGHGVHKLIADRIAGSTRSSKSTAPW